jgi:hypothetical protein
MKVVVVEVSTFVTWSFTMFKLASEYMFQNYLKGILVRMGAWRAMKGA